MLYIMHLAVYYFVGYLRPFSQRYGHFLQSSASSDVVKMLLRYQITEATGVDRKLCPEWKHNIQTPKYHVIRVERNTSASHAASFNIVTGAPLGQPPTLTITTQSVLYKIALIHTHIYTDFFAGLKQLGIFIISSSVSPQQRGKKLWSVSLQLMHRNAEGLEAIQRACNAYLDIRLRGQINLYRLHFRSGSMVSKACQQTLCPLECQQYISWHTTATLLLLEMLKTLRM